MVNTNVGKFPCLRPLKGGNDIVFAGRLITIGSASGSTLALPGTRIPPRLAHCLYASGAYRLQVLKREPAVKHNGRKVSGSAVLAHGDTLLLGNDGYRYLEREDTAVLSAVAESGADPVQGLVNIAVELLKNRDSEITAGLVARVSRLLRCDAARVVGEDAVTGERVTLDRYPPHLGLDRFSNRAIDWARDAGKTVLMHDSDWTDTVDPSVSLKRNAVASVLCAPLTCDSAVLGYLYLDRLDPACSFTEKDRDFCETLVPLFAEILGNADMHRRQRDTIERLQNSRETQSGGVVYQSEAMEKTMAAAARLAATNAPVLVLGETGTGKELMARFVHDHSSRAAGVFRAINCGAIPENLIESELFGHEKGAFTGAAKRKIGLMESAQAGTVFLDEIGELPLMLQVKLLRVLQEGEVTRVGGTEPISIDVRIVAATNRDLAKEVAEGRFREDLFYRLNVLGITIPALRDRGQDPLILGEFFLARYCEQFGLGRKQFSAAARQALVLARWPGNVRQLENAVQKAAVLSAGSVVQPADLGLDSAPDGGLAGRPGSAVETLRDARARAESQAISAALEKTGGTIAQAARLLDIDRKWLMKKMDELGVDISTFRT